MFNIDIVVLFLILWPSDVCKWCDQNIRNTPQLNAVIKLSSP